MAGDWIKMRVWLRRDPRVSSMADYLSERRAFMDFVTDPVRCHCNESVYEHITRDVTRAITVCSLLEVWGVARERGDRENDDLILKHCGLSSLDDICSVPHIGDAMEYVDWASEEVRVDENGREVTFVRFPKFFSDNESPEDRYKKQHAEAQARYRKKKASGSDKSVDVTRDVTSDITMTPREEKRREDIKTYSVPDGTDGSAAPTPRKKPSPDPVKDELWRLGRGLLETQGDSRETAGSFLGKLVKDHGQRRVLEAVREADSLRPAEAKAWLTARCQERSGGGVSKQAQLEARNAAVAAAWVPPELRDAAS